MIEHRYGTERDFSLGIEDELLLVDRGSRRLVHTSSDLLAAVGLERVSARHDIYAGQVELSSGPCPNAGEAVRELESLRAALRDAGGTALGAGIHPAGEFGDVEIVNEQRYLREAANMRGLVRRTPDCALHVHVGLPDPETAIRVCNALRERVPLLEALAANSPFWHGSDSGLASARRALRRGFPRVEAPPAFHDFGDYERAVAGLLAAGELADYTFVWWEVRPHPRLGTVELRAPDAQSSLAAVAAIAALVQGLAIHAAQAATGEPLAREIVAESSFRASRDGLDAGIWDGGGLRPARDVARDAVALARPGAREAGSEPALEEIERMLRDGNGADRQRSAHARGGMEAVLEQLVAETEAPLR